MNCLLSSNLKREISRFIHKKYYDVVLVELLDMTQQLPGLFDHYSHGMKPDRYRYHKMKVRVSIGEDNVFVPRWYCLPYGLLFRENNIISFKKYFE